MSSLADRLISGLRMHERERPYTLDRAAVATPAEGEVWLRTYRTPSGEPVWLGDGNERRRQMARRLLWIRWRFRREWQQRGGRDAG